MGGRSTQKKIHSDVEPPRDVAKDEKEALLIGHRNQHNTQSLDLYN